MEGRVEHLPTIEVRVDCLEEGARKAFGSKEASSRPSSFPLSGVLSARQRAAGVQGRER